MGTENVNEDNEEVIILLDDEETEREGDMPNLEAEIELEEPARIEFDDDLDNVEMTEYSDDDESATLLTKMGGKLLIGFGVLIAILAIGVGIFALSRKTDIPDVDFSKLGNNLTSIGVIGEANIDAITVAQGQRLEELYEAVNNYDYDEADQESGITTVGVTLTSILKDLKIKFVNTKDKLIGNVPFEVEVTLPNGKTETWTDEDKDGVIYMSEIAGGSYSVKLVKLDGYDDYYDFSQAKTESISVKTQLDYQKVDVKNEIKKATDAVTKKEDTKINETTVESKLADTVEYVMSQKVASGNGYAQVDKGTIADPGATLKSKAEASLFRFFRLSEDGGAHIHNYVNATHVEGTETHTKTCDVAGCPDDQKNITNDCSYGTCTSVSGEKHSKTCTECGNVVEESHGTMQWNNEPGTNGKHTVKCLLCDYTKDEDCAFSNSKFKFLGKNVKQHKPLCDICSAEGTSENCVDTNNDSVCDVCGGSWKVEVPEITDLKAEGTASYVYSSSGSKVEGTVNAKFTPAPDTSYEYAWAITNGDCVTIPENSTGDKVTLAIVKAGTATIRVTVTPVKDGVKGSAKNATLDITVTGSGVSIDPSGKKALFVGETLAIKGSATGGATNKLEWKSSNDAVAKVTASDDTLTGTVTAVAEGTVTISAISKDDSAIKKEMTVVVVKNPKDDKSTKLTDKNGTQVFVKDGDKYREATYADYYTASAFYTASAVSYKYNGWWTLDGKTYYFDKNGNKVTGEQVILGAKYTFNSDGSLKSGTGSFGIDVSVWNGTIDWDKVAKSGVNYAIIRCGFRGSSLGGLYSDNKFEANIKNATAAGVKVGIYFFTQAISEAEAVEEASMCLSMIEGYKLAYPIFIDVESSGGRADGLTKDQRTKIVQAFCKTISNAGYKAGVYANKNWLTTKFDPTQLTSYTIWLAQYAKAPSYTTTRYDIWQYSDAGSISGISGNVDLNMSYLGY